MLDEYDLPTILMRALDRLVSPGMRGNRLVINNHDVVFRNPAYSETNGVVYVIRGYTDAVEFYQGGDMTDGSALDRGAKNVRWKVKYSARTHTIFDIKGETEFYEDMDALIKK